MFDITRLTHKAKQRFYKHLVANVQTFMKTKTSFQTRKALAQLIAIVQPDYCLLDANVMDDLRDSLDWRLLWEFFQGSPFWTAFQHDNGIDLMCILMDEPMSYLSRYIDKSIHLED